MNRISAITEWNHPVINDKPAGNETKSLTARYDSNGFQVVYRYDYSFYR